MSRINEALVFKTDEERLAWFHSLTPEEQSEVVRDAQKTMDEIVKAFQPIRENIMAWWAAAQPVLQDISSKLNAAMLEVKKMPNRKRI